MADERKGIAQGSMRLEPFLRAIALSVTRTDNYGPGPERAYWLDDEDQQCYYLGAGYFRCWYSPRLRRLWLWNPDYTVDELDQIEQGIRLIFYHKRG